MTRRVAQRVFPTLTEPLPSRAELRERVGDEAAWRALFERPLGETVEERFTDDLVRGVVLTDALIGTFSHAHDPSLRQNRCFLYHVIGGGTGDWDVPVGGMGALTDALADAARAAGAEIRHRRTTCTASTPTASRAEVDVPLADGEGTVRRPATSWSTPRRTTLAGLLGEEPARPRAGGLAAEGEHAAAPAAAAAGRRRRPARGLRRHLPRRRGVRAARRRVPAGSGRAAARTRRPRRSTATR